MAIVRSLILPLALGLAACAPPPREAAKEASPPPQSPVEAKACAAVRQAILKERSLPASTEFGKCDAMASDGIHFTVAVAYNVGYVDSRGRVHMDTFDYYDAEYDPATGEMRAGKVTGGNR